MYKWKPSKSQKFDFIKKMRQIEDFCKVNHIEHSKSYDSYYFTIDGKRFRVSNHTVASSNSNGSQLYHLFGEKEFFQCITASKLRIIEIYTNLNAGLVLDRRGNVKYERS